MRELLSIFDDGGAVAEEDSAESGGRDQAGADGGGGSGSSGQDGVLCADVMLEEGVNPAAIFNSLHDCGVTVKSWQLVDLRQLGREGRALRLVAASGM